jgi:hypothetical protein
LNDDVGNWDFHDLKNRLFNHNNSFDDLWNFYDFFDDSRNNNNLFNYLFDLNYSRNLHNLLNDAFNNLLFDSNNFFFYNNWDRLLDMNCFNDFLLDWNKLNCFNLKLLNLFSEIGD